MDQRLKDWHPGHDELDRILAEMRPVIAEFARRARAETRQLQTTRQLQASAR